jgi:hypothetical protein
MNYKNNFTLNASQFFKSLILPCAVALGPWLAPNRSSAQEAPLNLSPLAFNSSSLDPNPLDSRLEPTTLPSSVVSTAGPADQPSDKDNSPIYACACGCGIFEVGTSSMLPAGGGGTVYFEYDYQDQNENYAGSSRAPAADNDDKEVRTSFFTAGIQYMFNRSWGIQAELPLDYRYFETTGGATGNEIVGNTWAALGDLRVEGIYTGFFPDMSAGVDFGFKLPTGDYTHNDAYDDIDRDAELGTGSTDVLLGGFYRNNIAGTYKWDWFAQLQADLPFTGRDEYLPGCEVDGALGVYYNGLVVGNVRIAPLAQALISYRAQDSGNEADIPVDSGFTRFLLSPGVEFDVHPWMFYLDAEFPVWQHFTSDQLSAPVLIKFIVSLKF